MLPLQGENLTCCSTKLIHFCQNYHLHWVASKGNILCKYIFFSISVVNFAVLFLCYFQEAQLLAVKKSQLTFAALFYYVMSSLNPWWDFSTGLHIAASLGQPTDISVLGWNKSEFVAPLISFSILLRGAEVITWKIFVQAKRDPSNFILPGWNFLHLIAVCNLKRVYDTAGIPAKGERISSWPTRIV